MASKRARKAHPPSKSQHLQSLRTQSDRMDRDILRLVNERASLASRIGDLKNESGLEVYSPVREEEVIQQVLQTNPGPLQEPCVRAIFRELMSGSRALQKILKVAYLGPEYSFSHIAALEKFGHSVDYLPVGTIQAVFEAVNRGHADF